MNILVEDGRITKAHVLEDHPLDKSQLCLKWQKAIGLVQYPDRLKSPWKASTAKYEVEIEDASWKKVAEHLRIPATEII
jgi:anaerobic selenocysteine-containing dehydrogenase